MKEGFEVIRGGVLKDKEWFGETDFLIRENTKSKFGDYSYVVYETKNTNKTKVDHIIQAGVYCDMLEQAQGLRPKTFSIVLTSQKSTACNS